MSPQLKLPDGNGGYEAANRVVIGGDEYLVKIPDGSGGYVAANSYGPTNSVHWFKGDEGTGTTLGDSVGSSTLTINGATWVSDSRFKGGYGLSFDGVDDYLSSSISSPPEFTIMMRLEIQSLNSSKTHNGIFGFGDHGGGEWVHYTSYANAWRDSSGIRISDSPVGELRTVVYRGTSSKTELQIYDEYGVVDSGVSSGVSPYGSFLINSEERPTDALMDPNSIICDSYLSDSEVNSIIQNYY